jgi:hypothetical protein
MSRREYLIVTPAVAVLSAMLLAAPAYTEESNPAALAAAVAGIPTTLEKGLQASESTVAPGGKLLVRDMGRTSTGSWQIENDRLCTARPGILQDCYEVWIAGDAIQLRSQDAVMPLTVFLRPATTR